MTRLQRVKEVKKDLVDAGRGFKVGFIKHADLSILISDETNRETNTTKVNKLAGTYATTGQNISPITLTKDFVTIDGQNRRDACIKAGTDAYVQVVPFTAEELIVMLNTTQKNWSMLNFFESNAKKNIEAYVEGTELLAEFGVDLSTLMVFLPVGNTGVKEGKQFDMPEDIRQKLSNVVQIKEAELKVLGNHRRISRWASAMSLIQNTVDSRIEESGENSKIAKEWEKKGFDKIIRDLPKVIMTSTAGDQALTLAGLLSKAFDYGSRKKLRLVQTN